MAMQGANPVGASLLAIAPVRAPQTAAPALDR